LGQWLGFARRNGDKERAWGGFARGDKVCVEEIARQDACCGLCCWLAGLGQWPRFGTDWFGVIRFCEAAQGLDIFGSLGLLWGYLRLLFLLVCISRILTMVGVLCPPRTV